MFSNPILKFAGYIVAVMLAYGALKGDVQVLQTKYDFIQQQIGEMKQDIRDIKVYMQAISERNQ